MCSLCYAVTHERCNNGCGGVVPVCLGCKRQGKTCSFCDDMREFGGGAPKPEASEDIELGSRDDEPPPSRKPARKSQREESASSSESTDSEKELISPGPSKSSSSRGRSSSQKSRGPARQPARQPVKEPTMLESLGLGDTTGQVVVGILALLILGMGVAYMLAPEQVQSVLDFGSPDEAVITQGFVEKIDGKACEAQTVHVTDRTACETAASFLKRRFGGLQSGGGPEGCYSRGFNVFYNSRSVSTNINDDSVHFICEIGVMYGELGDINCPKDAAPIMSETLCRSAAGALAQGWGGQTDVASKPRGCYEQEELLSINMHEVGGVAAEVKRVCASVTGATRAP